ncbi:MULTISPECIES: SIR2 family protein [Stutzerimonas stutzeri subgroup]|uniref:Signal transduction protein n=1 Tax=Stutzerimonas stutzeri CCUG 29243 TaxID=1196835 RepID=I4CXH2_STUST|nr:MULTISPECIES: SIR2 family protein [Stutzerimonas stutzeri subgroup]AFM34779.1 signal transduction protein [Stutzerimonas stutzeri CCUG 29243]MCQ2036686.1 SIR2 family protein [Stutzerimonas kunmingensis]
MGMSNAALDLEYATKLIKPSKDTILVVGTGMSMGLTEGKYPQLAWTGLIRAGFRYAVEIGKIPQDKASIWLSHLDGSPTTTEILYVAGFLSDRLSYGDGFDYTSWLKKEFSEVEVHNHTLATTVKALSDAGVKICTLNYDSLLESVTNLLPVYMTDSDEVIEWFKGERKGILHLHGHWKKPDTCILSSQDYQTTIQSSTRNFFQQHLTVFENLVFVGCGGTFEDPNFDKTLGWLREELKSTKHSTYALVKDSEVSARKADLAWKNIVEPIGFGTDYSFLGPFLDGLFQQVTSQTSGAYPDLRGNTVIQLVEQGQKTTALDGIHSSLPPAPQARSVRHAQSFQAEQILKLHKRLWLAADWGMGEDEFISGLITRLSNKTNKVYSVNICNYTDKASFYSQIGELLGGSFESFCSALSLIDEAYLLLRDVPLDTCDDKEKLQADLLSLTDILISFCPNLRVILTSRNLPPWRNEAVELTALDGADTRAYIESHPLYQGGLGHDDFTQLYEHTNGVPRIIQDSLDKLVVASLEEIISERSSSRINLTGRLSDSIKALSTAKEIEKRYAFSLLKSLSAFPYGEYLDNIKRVDKSKKYSIDHVVILQREGFIYIEDQDSFGHTGTRGSKKRLIVTRPVRQWLAQETKPREIAKIKNQAYQLYFGDNWEIRDPKLHHIFKANDISEKSSEINNAKYFIVEIFSEGKTTERWRTVGMDLASQFCATVSKKSYHKVVHDLYNALKSLLDCRDKDQQYWFFIYLCAQSIRMGGGKATKDEALHMLLDCLDHINQPKQVGSIKLEIAMIYSARNDHAKALEYASHAQKLTKGNIAMQASHIALKHGDLANKKSDISKIQAKAKSKAHILYSNIEIERTDELDETPAKVDMLKELVEYCHENKDLYNQIRATLRYADSKLTVHGSLDAKDVSMLISIYHHLHHDNLTSLHSQCHRILWTAFEASNDYVNLLQLFKYSSLYWRLRDEQKPELEAINKFKNLGLPETIPERDPAASYYYGRLATIKR